MATPEDDSKEGSNGRQEDEISPLAALNSFAKGIAENMQTNRDRVILEELPREYETNTDLRKHTEVKANTIIAFSGVILTLLLAFVGLSFDIITNEHLPLISAFLVAVILAIVTSLILSIRSVLLERNFDMASAIGILATNDDHVNLPGIEAWRNDRKGEREFLNQYMRIYIRAVLKNSNERKRLSTCKHLKFFL